MLPCHLDHLFHLDLPYLLDRLDLCPKLYHRAGLLGRSDPLARGRDNRGLKSTCLCQVHAVVHLDVLGILNVFYHRHGGDPYPYPCPYPVDRPLTTT